MKFTFRDDTSDKLCGMEVESGFGDNQCKTKVKATVPSKDE